jgi:hypothetical protein
MSESFLSRWSRRKRAEPEAVKAEDEQVAREIVAQAAPPPAVEPAPVPELPPIESLTPQADFSPFMKPQVPVQLKNAALKKLFTDPHFNVMDGLDTYIDDYTKPDPIPAAMLRSLAQSKALRLFDEEEEKPVATSQSESKEGGDVPVVEKAQAAPVAQADALPAPDEIPTVSVGETADVTARHLPPKPDAAPR